MAENERPAVREAVLLPGLQEASRILHANFDGTSSAAPHYIDEAIRTLSGAQNATGQVVAEPASMESGPSSGSARTVEPAPSPMVSEKYPPHWQHATIHLNPDTGEMHSDGDHRVRHWIQQRLKR